jgi:hypothetical protein
MLLAMVVWVLALWWFFRLLARAPAPERPAPVRTRPVVVLPDPPDTSGGVLEAELVRQRLAGELDAATYQERMAALAAAGPPSSSPPRGLRPSGR